MNRFQTRSILIVVLLIIVSLACRGTPAISSTLDPNAIQTAITQTFAAQSVLNTSTLLPTNTSEPTETSTAIATDTLQPTATIENTPTPYASSTPTSILNSVAGASCIPNNPVQTGKVVDVVDGDTIKVLMDQDGKTYTIRYIGMDTPEYTSQVEFYGSEAAVKNVQLVMGKTASLIKDVSETDRYGRLLRYVIVDDVFINYELVVNGFANPASFPPDIACIPALLQAEQQAKAANLGLWNAPPTTAPLATLVPITGGSSGGEAPCSCNGPDLDCGDFSSHASAQACYQYCASQGFGDVFKLDRDGDGSACETLP